MNYSFDRLYAQIDLIGKRCWYKKPYVQDLTFSKIKEVNVIVTNKHKEVQCELADGVIAVLHTHNCPDYIGSNKVWGFLSADDCNRYWDM